MCEIKTYKDEDSVIKDLLETNIRQRGDIGGSAKDEMQNIDFSLEGRNRIW